MRADAHYVDVLTSSPSGQPVRLLPIGEIDAMDGPFEAEAIARLARSIRVHGIVHPLLVRRHGLKYAVIAGRKRLAAARGLGLAALPCLVHQVDEREAPALAEADNMTAGRIESDDRRPVLAGVRQALSFHLAAVQTSAEMVAGMIPSMRRTNIDLIKAHVWRASRLLDVIDRLTGMPAPPAALQPLPALVEQVIAGFGAEARLSRVALRSEIAEGAASCLMPGPETMGDLAAAVCAVLPLLEFVEDGRLTIRIGVPATHAITIDIVASVGPLPTGTALRFFDSGAGDRAGGWCAVAGALVARMFAERHGGNATFTPQPDPFLRMTLLQPTS
jgi:hypothetical protein